MFPKMTPEQYADFKETILSNGKSIFPLAVWEETGILLDGHHRDRLCRELGIKPPIKKMSFADCDQAKKWAMDNQFTRRNMNTFQRIEVAIKQFGERFAEKARANKHGGVSLNSEKGIVVDEELAKLAKTSADSVGKVRKILEKSDVPEIAEAINALRNDEPGVSIHSVHKKIQESKSVKKVTRPLITEAKPVRRRSEVPPEQASPVQQGNDEQPRQISNAIRKAKVNASLATKANPSRSLNEQVDTLLCIIEDHERTFSKPEDLSYFYEVINQWVKQKKEELLDALGY